MNQRKRTETEETLGVLPGEQDQANTPNPDFLDDPRNQFTSQQPKLDVQFNDPHFFEEWYPYWFVDRDLRLVKAQQSGYKFVERSEVVDNGYEITPRDSDSGERVRRHAGAGTEGSVEYHYLMKKPLALHKRHEAEREQKHIAIDEALRAGTIGGNLGDGRYTAERGHRGSTSIPPISTQLGRFK